MQGRPKYARGTQAKKIAILIAALFLLSGTAFADSFTVGDVVVAVEGNGVNGATSGPYTDNQAAPLTLFEYNPAGTTSASYVFSEQLPQTNSNGNFAVSGEYGSSSEGTLQLSGNGEYLTIMGYGINAATFNADPGMYSLSPTNTALGQSGSMQGQTYTAVPRVVALINGDGVINSTTALYNIFNGNNPRSAYTVDGTTIYVSGQGNSPDTTGGVFITTLGSSSASPITGTDTTSGGVAVNQDTREVQIYDNTLYVSVDTKEGSGSARSYIGTLGTPPATGVYNSNGGPTMLSGFGNTGGTGKITVSAATFNGVNTIGSVVNLDPENYFFASPTVLYVADGGDTKQTSAASPLGDGGLQKWVDVAGTWTLEYTLSTGLNLQAFNTPDDGNVTSGLYGLTGELIDGGTEVELFATTFSPYDTDDTYLYGITDLLSATSIDTAGGLDTFSQLAEAPGDSTFKGVSMAPSGGDVPEPSSLGLLALGLGALLTAARRRKRAVSLRAA